MHRFKEWLTGSVKRFNVSRKERRRKMNKRNELPDERQDNRDDTANERAYEALEITITVFVNEDVITASGDDGEWDTD